jgi:succinate dehydrogenase / fumarate reductase iron-sulfur subunit
MFNDGDTITIEPFRAGAFPVVKDLVVDSAFDRIQHAGGFISVNTQVILLMQTQFQLTKMLTLLLMQRLVLCACVATCKNSSAMLFVCKSIPVRFVTSRIEATDRVLNMVSQMDAEGFGNCTNRGL